MSSPLEWLASARRDLAEFAARLVGTPSENPPGDERAVVAALEEELERLGLTDRQVVAKEPHRPNLIVRLPGAGAGPRLLLSGHTDTKPVGDRAAWRTDPLTPTVREGRLYGRGAMDMKGSVAALVYAAAALQRHDLPLRGELWLVLTADEENGGVYGARHLAGDWGLRADAALVAEPSGIHQPWEFLALGARGVSCFKLKVRGTQVHSAIGDQIGAVSASLKAAALLTALARDFRPRLPGDLRWPRGPTFNWGARMESGVFYGVWPGHAEIGTDVRTVPGMTQQALEEDLRSFLSRLSERDPELEVELEFESEAGRWIPPMELAADHPLVEAALSAAETVLGRRPPLGLMPAVTDAAWFHSLAAIPAIPAFGPGLLTQAHSPNESIALEELLQAAQIYALTAERYPSG